MRISLLHIFQPNRCRRGSLLLSLVRNSFVVSALVCNKGAGFLREILLVFALLFWGVVPVSAQLALILPEVKAEPGEVIEMDATIEGFAELVALQFSLNWDKSTLKLDSVYGYDLPGLQPGNFAQIAEDTLVMSWLDFSLQGVDRPDGATLFTLRFELIGAEGDSGRVYFSNEPISMEANQFKNGTNIEVPVEPVSGLVVLSTSTAFAAVSAIERMILPPFPNPTSGLVHVPLEVEQAEKVLIRVVDGRGKEVFVKEEYLYTGQQQLDFQLPNSLGEGSYWVTLKGPHINWIKPLIFAP